MLPPIPLKPEEDRKRLRVCTLISYITLCLNLHTHILEPPLSISTRFLTFGSTRCSGMRRGLAGKDAYCHDSSSRRVTHLDLAKLRAAHFIHSMADNRCRYLYMACFGNSQRVLDYGLKFHRGYFVLIGLVTCCVFARSADKGNKLAHWRRRRRRRLRFECCLPDFACNVALSTDRLGVCPRAR